MRRKSIWVWFGEALLIFISVLGAFWIEDYRHNRQEYQDYLNVLLNLRNDLNNDITDFNYMIDSSALGGGTYLYFRESFESINQILGDENDANNHLVFAIAQESIHPIPDWRQKSEYFEILSSYSKYLINDSLVSTLRLYEYVMNLEDQIAEEWNVETRKYADFVESNVDLDQTNRAIPSITNSIFIKNWFIRMEQNNEERISFDQKTVDRLVIIREELDNRLRAHGVSPSLFNEDTKLPTFLR